MIQAPGGPCTCRAVLARGPPEAGLAGDRDAAPAATAGSVPGWRSPVGAVT